MIPASRKPGSARLPALVAILLALGSLSRAGEDGYVLESIPTPEEERIEVGGLDFLPDGRLVVSTRRGRVWIVENALADDPAVARFHLFAQGLHEGLGLEVVGDDIYVVQRGELSRLIDTDGDDVCDRVETVCDDWGLSGNYHEFAFGLPRDDAGNFYVGLNVAFSDPWWHGRSPVPYRGWVVRVSPTGEMTPVAAGFRSPCGLGRNRAGDLFVTDNQGDWMPSSPIFHLKDGAFYGHPASLAWTDAFRGRDEEPSLSDPPAVRRAPAAVWIPYGWSRSTGNLVADDTGGRFGPFDDQLFVAELTNGYLLRASLEKVRGDYQGAVFLFREGVGSAVRVRFAPDGSLFIGRTNRGWGGQAPADGLARLRYTGTPPMEMQHVHLLQDGFEVRFTRPLAPDCRPGSEDVHLVQFDYNYWWEYGSPEYRTDRVAVVSVEVAEDRRSLTIRAPGLRPGKVARGILANITAEGGLPLVHAEFDYTVNQLPEGPRYRDHVAKLVPPPPPVENWLEGWLLLTEGDAGDAWSGEGWQVVDPNARKIRVNVDDPRQIRLFDKPETEEPVRWRSLLHDGSAPPSTYTCRYEHGTVLATLDFFLPKGGTAGVLLAGRYELRLRDTRAGGMLTADDLGGIAPGSGFPGRAPKFNASSGPGQWHNLSVWFAPPVFDEEGNKTADARFLRVKVNDILLHESVRLPGPSAGSPLRGEAATGPLVLRAGERGAVFRRISLKPMQVPPDDEGWETIFNRIDLDGWKRTGEATWRVEDGVLVGSGPAGHLFSPRGDYTDLELRADVKISDGGNSGMYFRTRFGPGWPQGYEAQVNSTYDPDPVKTGSLYNLELVKTSLVPPNVWFRQHVTCRDEEDGVRIVIRLNDIVVVDHLDRERRHASGHVALQQHHEDSEVRYRNVQVRELE